jgi:hypothetical protein
MSVATNTGSTGIFEEPTASLFQAARTEVIINRPAQDVWLVLTDLSYPTIHLWNPTVVSVEHISGEPRQVNEFVLVTKDKSTGESPFYMRTIRVVPHQQRVLRVDAIDGRLVAFVDHSLYELEGRKTRLVYNGYIETRRHPVHELKAFDSKTAEEEMMQYLNLTSGVLLKKAVEERSPDQSRNTASRYGA